LDPNEQSWELRLNNVEHLQTSPLGQVVVNRDNVGVLPVDGRAQRAVVIDARRPAKNLLLTVPIGYFDLVPPLSLVSAKLLNVSDSRRVELRLQMAGRRW
jgi:hypothetical protein